MRNVLAAVLPPWFSVVFMMCFGLWLNTVWPRIGMPNYAGVTTNLVTVAVMLPFVWNQLRVGHIRNLLLLILAIRCADGAVLGSVSIAYLWGQAGHVWFHVSPTVEMMGKFSGTTPNEVLQFISAGELFSAGSALWLIQACVSAPLWEELLRGYAHRALAVLHLPAWMCVLAIAFWFCIIHKGFAISTFPGFIILGLMVERGYNWGQRAMVHAVINALTVVDSITVYLGGTRLDSYAGMFTSLGLQVAGLLALCLWGLDRVRKNMSLEEDEREKAAASTALESVVDHKPIKGGPANGSQFPGYLEAVSHDIQEND